MNKASSHWQNHVTGNWSACQKQPMWKVRVRVGSFIVNRTGVNPRNVSGWGEDML